MVDAWTLSDDRLTYSFTLRDGLKWHDGKPVTAEDCIASLKRWGARDSTGVKLMSFVAGFEAVNDKTFKLVLKEPYGLVIDSLAKPGGSTPLMMPKRIADTDPAKQIERVRRLRPLHLQEGRVEARRQDRLCPQSRLRAAQGAALGPGRRQGGQGRPRRMARHPRPPDRGERAAGRRDRLYRGAAARPEVAAAGRQERHARRSTTRSARNTCSAGTPWCRRSTTRSVRRAAMYAFDQKAFLRA